MSLRESPIRATDASSSLWQGQPPILMLLRTPVPNGFLPLSSVGLYPHSPLHLEPAFFPGLGLCLFLQLSP